MDIASSRIFFQWNGSRYLGRSRSTNVEILDEVDVCVRVVEEDDLDASFEIPIGRRPRRIVRALVLDGVVHLPAFFAEEDSLRRAVMPVRPMTPYDVCLRRDVRYGRRSWWLDPFAVRSPEDDFLVRRRPNALRSPAVAADETDLADESRLDLASGLEEAGHRTVFMDGLVWSSRYQIVVERNDFDGRTRTRIVDGLAGTLAASCSARRLIQSIDLGEWTTLDLPGAIEAFGREAVEAIVGVPIPDAVTSSPFDMVHETVVAGAADIGMIAFEDPVYDLGGWPDLDHFLVSGDFRCRDEAHPDDLKALMRLATGTRDCRGWETMAEAVRRQAWKILKRVNDVARIGEERGV